MKKIANSFLAALQFLTILPVPLIEPWSEDTFSQAAVFFPIVGLLIGAGAVGLDILISAHVNRQVAAFVILVYLVVITGALHEDALADAADGFGGGRNRDRILAIMADSRIGSFGGLVLILATLGRWVLLVNLPATAFHTFLIAGTVLGRWTALPLAFWLPPARSEEGQGARLAGRISWGTLLLGTLFTAIVLAAVLHTKAIWPFAASVLVTVTTAIYYRRSLGGVTGDCFGATNQLTELGVYFAGVLLR